MTCNDLNRHERDCRLAFYPETHKYILDGVEELESVTTLVENSFCKFDAEYWATKKSFGREEEKQRLLDLWERRGREARELGTLMHDRIERHYLGETLGAEVAGDPTFARFATFARHYHLKPYRTEWRIFSRRYAVAGTLDFLEYDGSKFTIYDWKRSNKVVDASGNICMNSYKRTGFAPLDNLPDTVYIHYAMQISIYRFILAEHYGIDVAEAYLGVFHPDLPVPFRVGLPYLRNEVIKLLSPRQK